jgi:uncharacterized protein (UPF0335 family)
MSAIGDNSKEQLRSIVERLENLEVDKAAIASDIKDVFAEAKSNGYDVKALRTVMRMRKQDKAKQDEQEAILESYLQVLGMI